MKTYNILFLCTGNSARSIMAEALATVLSKGRLIGYSAGSAPVGHVNPFALEKIKPLGYPLEKLRSKSWDEFARPDAPQMDFIITVCASAAGEACPVWPGRPASAHWGFEDPAAVEGSDAEKRRVFNDVFVGLSKRIELLSALPIETLDHESLRNRMQEIDGHAR
ncbi:MAG: arsenate reductase ArsC [Betaproteobacteria bacterium]|nr:arsenate reductase ArsC [Betaproteobacteria bacterium]NBT74540.1 arsenate reductase ArsC [Betaproteobacteria bacterium]